ncbi:hypothetical protein F5Y04DRAFT_281828 [Hypomontagnella monticulosa]|nr:hypothetical protein F5Y04DRAFT_281828 [Hypomontagnella monticulosa]
MSDRAARDAERRRHERRDRERRDEERARERARQRAREREREREEEREEERDRERDRERRRDERRREQRSDQPRSGVRRSAVVQGQDRDERHRAAGPSRGSHGSQDQAIQPTYETGAVDNLVSQWMQHLSMNDSAVRATQAGQAGSTTGVDPNVAVYRYTTANSGFMDPNTAPSRAASYYNGSLPSLPSRPDTPDMPPIEVHEPGWIPPERQREQERDNQVIIVEDPRRRRRRRERRADRHN